MADWAAKAKEIMEKIKSYKNDKDGWKLSKSSGDITVYEKTSPDWNGMLYKVEAEVCAPPETVFSYIDPSPSSNRSQWDKAIKELQLIEKISDKISAVRTITHSAFGGLISSRDFTDLVINENNDEYISTSDLDLSTQSGVKQSFFTQFVEHPNCPASSDFVRGRNYPCAIICFRIPGEPKKTRVTSYIQTDLGGMLPKSLVENALPSNQINFFNSLRSALKEGGVLNGSVDGVHSG